MPATLLVVTTVVVFTVVVVVIAVSITGTAVFIYCVASMQVDLAHLQFCAVQPAPP